MDSVFGRTRLSAMGLSDAGSDPARLDATADAATLSPGARLAVVEPVAMDAVAPRIVGIASRVTFADAAVVRGEPQLLNGQLHFTDKANWTLGGTLTVSGIAAYDRVSILGQGDGAGQVGVEGDTIRYGGVAIGTVAGGNGTTLTVTFNAAATADAVTAVAGRLAYQLGDGAAADHSLQLTFTDGQGTVAANATPYEAIIGQSHVNPFAGLIAAEQPRIVIGDLNGDGHLDYISYGDPVIDWRLANYDDPDFLRYEEDSTGPIYKYDENGNLLFADLDRSPTARIFLNDGTDHYVMAGAFAQGTATNMWLSLADADGDGDLDLFLSYGNNTIRTHAVYVSHNDGTGSFGGVSQFSPEMFNSLNDLYQYPYGMYVGAGDLDNDGVPDVLMMPDGVMYWHEAGRPYPGQLLVVTGPAGTAVLSNMQDLPPVLGTGNPQPWGKPFILDFDGDGDSDIVTFSALLPAQNTGVLTYYENIGNGQFVQHGGASDPFRLLGAITADDLTFADVDGDGDLDVVIVRGTETTVLWNNSSYGAKSNSLDGSITLNFTFPQSGNADPVMDLHLDPVIEADEASYRAIAPDAIVSDTDSADFDGGTLSVSFTGGASADEGVFIGAQLGLYAVGGTILYQGVLIGTYTGGDDGNPLVATFNGLATPALVQVVVRSLVYYNNSFDTAENRDISFVLTDGDGGVSPTTTVTVHIQPVDSPVMPDNDSATTLENMTVVIDVRANDVDPDGGAAETIAAIDGMAIAAGETVTLSSGARVTLNADGTLTYDPHGAYDWLVSAEGALLAGVANTLGYDGFYYTLSGGGEAYVDVEIGGVDGVGDRLIGTLGDDVITGRIATSNFFDLRDGGSDHVIGGNAGDAFYLGGAWDASDVLEGGSGSDQIGVQGSTTVVLGAASMTGIEALVFLSGSDMRFGGMSGALYSYDITTNDANVAAGQTLVVQANTLRAGENLTFNGAAEQDGKFLIYGGEGTDVLTGGQQDDGFYFGVGRWSANDRVDGQGGDMDQLGLQGDYSGAHQIVFGANQLTSIEMIVLLSGADTRFNGGGSLFGYTLVMNDANALAGTTMTVQGNTLRAGETMIVDARLEQDAHYRIYGGAGNDTLIGGALGDEIWGGAGNDVITGGGGADDLHGGSGTDTFVYTSASDSTVAARDHIYDFTSGDVINVATIGLNSFHAGGFTSVAGQVTATWTGSTWLVEGDVDGDGIADLSIQVDQSADYGWSASDFMLGTSSVNGMGALSAQEPGNDIASVLASSLFSGEPAMILGNDDAMVPPYLLADPVGLHHL